MMNDDRVGDQPRTNEPEKNSMSSVVGYQSEYHNLS